MENKIYEYKYLEKGLTAFMSNFEKKLNEIYPEIPVFVLETGDETYLFKKKFEQTTEIYQKVPRVVFSINDIEFQTDQDTNQYTKIVYRLNDNNYSAQFRRKAINLPVICNFVCSNFIRALEYLEALSSILSIDNAFTYEHIGSNQQGSFNLTSISMEKNPMEFGGSKNFVIKVNIDLQLQIYLVRYHTIVNLGHGGGTNSGNINGLENNGLTPVYDIESKNNVETYYTKVDPNDSITQEELDNEEP